uniref:Uncharacterized protein n=1 Tax=Arundo donax TaxID=35708 RepID=A0A0A9E2R8_ARUDO
MPLTCRSVLSRAKAAQSGGS